VRNGPHFAAGQISVLPRTVKIRLPSTELLRIFRQTQDTGYLADVHMLIVFRTAHLPPGE
jgi:hypothetical protein